MKKKEPTHVWCNNVGSAGGGTRAWNMFGRQTDWAIRQAWWESGPVAHSAAAVGLTRPGDRSASRR